MAEESEPKETNIMPSTYKSSLSTGVYGSYQVRQSEYKASLSTGVYGSYQVISTKSTQIPKEQTKPQPNEKKEATTEKKKEAKDKEDEEEEYEETTITVKVPNYTYYPSMSSGVFGTWKYNDTSPYKGKQEAKKIIKTKKKKKTTTTTTKRSSGYSSYWGRKKEPKEYKFEIRGPRLNEPITKAGKKFNVKLLQEYILPMGQPLARMIKKQKALEKKKTEKTETTKDEKDKQDASDTKEQLKP